MMPNNVNLMALRRTLKLTQAELAALVGVNISTVWRWENEGLPSKGSARAFIEYLSKECALSPEGNSPALSSAGDGGVPLVLTDGTPQPISRSPDEVSSGDAGVQLQSPRGCTPELSPREVSNDRM